MSTKVQLLQTRIVELNRLIEAEKAGDNDPRYLADLNDSIEAAKKQIGSNPKDYEMVA